MQAQPRGSYMKTASFSTQREERRLEATPPHTHAFRPEVSPNPSGIPWPCATPLVPVIPLLSATQARNQRELLFAHFRVMW